MRLPRRARRSSMCEIEPQSDVERRQNRILSQSAKRWAPTVWLGIDGAPDPSLLSRSTRRVRSKLAVYELKPELNSAPAFALLSNRQSLVGNRFAICGQGPTGLTWIFFGEENARIRRTCVINKGIRSLVRLD